MQNYFKHCTNLLCTGAGPMADMSGPVPANNNESPDVSGTVGVDECAPLRLDRELGVTLSDVGFSVFVKLLLRRMLPPRVLHFCWPCPFLPSLVLVVFRATLKLSGIRDYIHTAHIHVLSIFVSNGHH